MKRNLLALLWLTGEGAESKPRCVPLTQDLLGKSIFQLTVETVRSLGPERILAVTGPGDEPAGGPFAPLGVQWLRGGKAAGPLAAVGSVRDFLAEHPSKNIIVLEARQALLSPRSLRALLLAHQKEKNSLTIAAGTEQTPAFIAKICNLLEALVGLGRRNKTQQPINDLIRIMSETGKKTGSYRLRHPEESLAIHTPKDLSRAIAFLRRMKLAELESRGVIVLDPTTTWVGLDVRIGPGTVIYPSAVIEGRSTIGAQCRVYPFVHLIDTQIGDRVKVLSSTMIERSRIEDDAQIGPFTHFRPNTVIRSGAKVGNFVEMKNTVFGERSKAGHLSYLGDALIEEGVNIGAGTITCNYDGFKKSQTIIERDVFVGSGTELIAPVRIGRSAYIGAGSVITKDVSPESLALARGRQVEKKGWVHRRKTK
jgi:bifunctional UDP-N-acetylglucosamine pyrophosphorylase/glucosamine-1-phosphate N-acetyltransferase